jgi:hypothetical protein
MNSRFELIDSGWDKVVSEAVSLRCSELRFISPFIKFRAAKRLLAGGRPELIRVITRFHPGEMCAGVSDPAALRLLLESGAKIRGIRGLHAKMYLFGGQRAIVTSANLTEAALLRNHEFGFVSSEQAIIRRCREYFDQLWQRAGADLDLARLEGWERKIAAARLAGNPPSAHHGLQDEGADAGIAPPGNLAPSPGSDTPQAFVKFFGQGNDRSPWDHPVLEEVRGSGSHWACTYPANKRPRRVRDGDVMFMGRLVADPHDVVIYGRATGLRHVDGRDMATPADIAQRPWKEDWPAYVRVHSAEFVAGTLQNGVRLSALMDELQSDAFVSTQRNKHADAGGNIDPRRALMQKAHMQLTAEAIAWLEARLHEAFEKHGRLTPAELETLDWPEPEGDDFAAYESWLVQHLGLRANTAREYVYFLKRCAAHYPVKLNPTTVPDAAAADVVVAQIANDISRRGRWTEGAFNERDLTQNLRPALRAYARFNASAR